jgi:hypothetical protein
VEAIKAHCTHLLAHHEVSVRELSQLMGSWLPPYRPFSPLLCITATSSIWNTKPSLNARVTMQL